MNTRKNKQLTFLSKLVMVWMVASSPVAMAQLMPGMPQSGILGSVTGLVSGLVGGAGSGDGDAALNAVFSPINGSNNLISDVEMLLPGIITEPLPGLGSSGGASDPLTGPIIGNVNVIGIANLLNPIIIEANPLVSVVPVIGTGGGVIDGVAAIFHTGEAILATDLTDVLGPFPQNNPLNLLLLQFENTVFESVTSSMSEQSNLLFNEALVPLLSSVSGVTNSLAPAVGGVGDTLTQ